MGVANGIELQKSRWLTNVTSTNAVFSYTYSIKWVC